MKIVYADPTLMTLDEALDMLQTLDVFDVVIRPYPTEHSTGHHEGRFLAFPFTGSFTSGTPDWLGTLPVNGWGKTATLAVQDLLTKRLLSLGKLRPATTSKAAPNDAMEVVRHAGVQSALAGSGVRFKKTRKS
jgi:hypothetical protein